MGMNSEALFGMALGLQPPWQVVKIAFAPNESGREELHLTLGFPPGSRFPDADGTPCPVHDTVGRAWQHLSFFEHPCRIHCAVPRIKAPGGKAATVAVPAPAAASRCCSRPWRWP